jgi:hypothetical protein
VPERIDRIDISARAATPASLQFDDAMTLIYPPSETLLVDRRRATEMFKEKRT